MVILPANFVAIGGHAGCNANTKNNTAMIDVLSSLQKLLLVLYQLAANKLIPCITAATKPPSYLGLNATIFPT